MAEVLQYTPGSQVTILLQVLGSSGQREDGYSTPVINKLILPDLSESTLYPLDMIRIDTGLYYHRFTLLPGAIAIGTYIVDIAYTNAAGDPKYDFVQVICLSTGGQFSVSPG